jgi:hypothetical protein
MACGACARTPTLSDTLTLSNPTFRREEPHGLPFYYSTRSNLPQTLTIYGRREATIYSFEEDSEFPVYSRQIKSLHRQSLLVIEITKLVIENYYYYDLPTGTPGWRSHLT